MQVLTRTYSVALTPRPGSKDLDLAALQLCETLAKLYPDLEPVEIRSLARQYVSFLDFGRRPSQKDA